jgi:hypothetical protein
MLSYGDAILMPASGSLSLHLWIIITDPAKDSGKAVVVSITTLRRNSDPTILVTPRDHPWIKHESVVMYADARIIDTVMLEEAIKTKPDDYMLQSECSVDFVNRIRGGLLRSQFTPNKIRGYCIKSWNS